MLNLVRSYGLTVFPQVFLNQTLDIRFHSCAACGFEWVLPDHQYVLLQVGKLKSSNLDFCTEKKNLQNDVQSYLPPEIEGGTGKHQFQFTPTAPGTEILQFQYRSAASAGIIANFLALWQ
jgi:hypothetical protein